MRRHASGAGCGACGFASQAASGTPRVTVRPYYGGPPFSGLDAGRMKGGESLPDQGGRDAPCPAPEATVPGAIAAVKRRKPPTSGRRSRPREGPARPRGGPRGAAFRTGA